MEKYTDRYEAGRVLAKELVQYANSKNTIVLALPRGGVPVAYEISQALSIPLDVFIVRKLGVPDQPELAMGAIASGEIIVFNDEILRELSIPQYMVDAVIKAEKKELKRRELCYRGNRPFPILEGKNVILVDDGIATGATIKAAIRAIRQKNPAKIIVAVPVAAAVTCDEIASLVEKVICPLKPRYFNAVGAWYDQFSQTEDEEVFKLLGNPS